MYCIATEQATKTIAKNERRKRMYPHTQTGQPLNQAKSAKVYKKRNEIIDTLPKCEARASLSL